MRIDLGAIRMDGTADAAGTVWHVDRLEGWDGAEEELIVIGPTGRSGEVLGSHQYRSRLVTLGGSAQATSSTNMWAAHNSLAALVGLSTATTLSVYEPTTKSLDVIRAGKPNISIRSELSFRWEVTLKALNPYKRGASHTSSFTAGQTKTISYAGTAVGFPVITTTGTGTVDVENTTTATRIITSSVPSGTVVDTYARTVYSGTTNNFSKVSAGVLWPSLAVGNNTVKNNGTAPMTLTWYDLYL